MADFRFWANGLCYMQGRDLAGKAATLDAESVFGADSSNMWMLSGGNRLTFVPAFPSRVGRYENNFNKYLEYLKNLPRMHGEGRRKS